MAIEKCTSCNAPLAESGATKFYCPACCAEIKRSVSAGNRAMVYNCGKSGSRWAR